MNITDASVVGYRYSVVRSPALEGAADGGIMEQMSELGKILIFLGVLLAVFGVLLVFGNRLHLPMGRLPGDIVYRGKNTTLYFPIVTSIVISIVLSLVFYLMGRFSK
jgi:hypothetical protein